MVLHLPFLVSNWNVKMLVLEERGKLEYPEKNLSEQERANNKLNPQIYGVNMKGLHLGHISGS